MRDELSCTTNYRSKIQADWNNLGVTKMQVNFLEISFQAKFLLTLLLHNTLVEKQLSFTLNKNIF